MLSHALPLQSANRKMAANPEGEERAKKSDWHTKPMPEECTTIEMSTKYSTEAMKYIRKGTVPEEMEDKWFMYYEEEEDRLYMHRSWTGYCVYILKFEIHEDGSGSVVSMIVNRNSEEYLSTDDEKDAESAVDILKWILYADPS